MDLGDLISRFPQMAVGLHEAVAQAVRQVAGDVATQAKSNAPVDTGFMKSAIYTVTNDSSTYMASGEHALPPVDAPGDDQTAIVAAGASYSIYVEMGTYKMAAQPFLTPAAAGVEQNMAITVAGIIADKLSSLGLP